MDASDLRAGHRRGAERPRAAVVQRWHAQEAPLADRHLRIFESELSVIFSETAGYRFLETGGLLLGLWNHTHSPTVFIATRPGPDATREEGFLALSPQVYQATEALVWRHLGLQVVGFWHSHHRLGIPRLSGGDVLRTMRYARRTGRERFCEVLSFFQPGADRIALRPTVYADARRGHALTTDFAVIDGVSPLRRALPPLPDAVGDAFAPGPGPMWPPPILHRSRGFEAVPAHPRPPQELTTKERPAIHALAEWIDRSIPANMHDAVALFLPCVGQAELTIDHGALSLSMQLDTVPGLRVRGWRVHAVGRDQAIAQSAAEHTAADAPPATSPPAEALDAVLRQFIASLDGQPRPEP